MKQVEFNFKMRATCSKWYEIPADYQIKGRNPKEIYEELHLNFPEIMGPHFVQEFHFGFSEDVKEFYDSSSIEYVEFIHFDNVEIEDNSTKESKTYF
jgi:hypothetical protein